MCYEYDDYPEFSDTAARTARKVHRCDECREDVGVGERYLRHLLIWDYGPETFCVCRRCVYDLLRIRQAELAAGCEWGNSLPAIGELREALHERGWQPTPCDQVPAEFDVAQYMEAEA